MPKSKRGLIIADFHSGHKVGLTPDEFNTKAEDDIVSFLARQQTYKNYVDIVGSLAPFDFVIFDGDAIEGKAPKQGGNELLYTDRIKQCQLAEAALKVAIRPGKTKLLMAEGTPYHVGHDEDFEKLIAQELHAEHICDQHTADVNGLLINYRHYVSSSVIPWSRGAGPARERFMNLMWSEHGEFPKADVIVRAHVHYFSAIMGSNWLAMTLPALQGYGTKYGAAKCSGTIDWGVVYFDVTSKTEYSWDKIIIKNKAGVNATVKI